MTDRRWDTDERGTGIADAAAAVPSLTRLLAKAHEPGWVAEDPAVHLIPHLVAAAPGLRLAVSITDASADGLEIAVTSLDADGARALRTKIHGLVGSIAEASTHVRELEPIRVFEVVTGMLDGDGPFAAHGHVLRIVVAGDGPTAAGPGLPPAGSSRTPAG